mmetsp:Transcript_4878/g.8238  ORF Transcript_4878/g.8238 Transcript_4878/m.8238 type:complete len:93 (-) Transcript_4878:374-652(-)
MPLELPIETLPLLSMFVPPIPPFIATRCARKLPELELEGGAVNCGVSHGDTIELSAGIVHAETRSREIVSADKFLNMSTCVVLLAGATGNVA